jgi:uncharacterized protein (TIGR00730 family)
MQNICVFCSSNLGTMPVYQEVAGKLGKLMATNGYRLIYGGANVGLMRCTAEAVLQNGGEAVGVITTFLAQKHLTQKGLQELIVVESMQERKVKMAEMADGFIVMPGGYGTLEEVFEVLTAGQLGFHKKPVVFLNVEGYYDLLHQQLQHMVNHKMLLAPHAGIAQFADTPEQAIELLHQYEAPVIEKWIDHIRMDNGHEVE